MCGGPLEMDIGQGEVLWVVFADPDGNEVCVLARSERQSRQVDGARIQMSEVSRAVAAAMSIASALDLPVDDAIVLHDSNKLTLRLLPCDVLARVAHVGQEVAQFEVELAQRFAEIEGPVLLLSREWSRAAAALQELGSSGAIVCTTSSNVGAVATYESAGFWQLPEIRDQ